MSIWQSLLPVGTLILGGAMSQFQAWSTGRVQRRTAREDREIAATEALLDRRKTFELENLFRAQTALRVHQDKLIELAFAYVSPERPVREAAERFSTASFEVIDIAAMILDDNVRLAMMNAIAVVGDLAGRLKTEPTLDISKSNHPVADALMAIGLRIRTLYAVGPELGLPSVRDAKPSPGSA